MRTMCGCRRGVSLFLGSWLLLSGLAVPLVGNAAEVGWPLPHDAEVALGFGASYMGADGRSATHRGVDLAAAPGDDVLAPSSGEVRFVGRVPATAGGTQLAATILRADGVSLTFMPLADACVSSGEAVSAGQRIAGLATEGDASTSATHLHVGARRGDLYVDPMQFLEASPATTVEPPAAETPTPIEASERPAAAVSPDPVVVEAPEATAAIAEFPAGSFSGAAGEVPEPAQRAVEVEPEAQSRGATGVSPVFGSARVAADTLKSPLAAGVAPPPAPQVAASLARGTAAAFAPAAGSAALLVVPSPTADVYSVPAALAGDAPPSVPGPTVAAASARELSVQGLHLPTAASVASAVRRVGRAWFLALLGSLAGAGALWPLWRRSAKPHEEELRSCVGPGGTDVATAAGR